MFERYTESARWTIFQARSAALPDSKYIEAHHLLLGLIRTDAALFGRVLGSEMAVAELEKEAVSTSPQHPVEDTTNANPNVELSNEGKRIILLGMQEADDLHDTHIGTEHLLLAILGDHQNLAAQMLARHGVELESVRRMVRSDACKS